jgi:acetyl esterase/lipase
MMDQFLPSRRTFLRTMTAVGAAGFPLVSSLRAATVYDPAATFEISVREVEFRRTAAGRQLMARVYQPNGRGPFPTILDLHGGAVGDDSREQPAGNPRAPRGRHARAAADHAGGLDDNVLPAIQDTFAATYRAAGGDCTYQLFEGCQHEWVATPGPQTDRARAMVKAFIAKHVGR